jgi:hypothetical protein
LIELFRLNWPEHEILTNGSTWTFKHHGVDYNMMSNAEWILVPDYEINGRKIERVEM